MLAGRVVNENSAPVHGARIVVRLPPSENVVCETTSDAAGAFSCETPGADTYSVSVQLEGFFRLDHQAVSLSESGGEATFVLNPLREVFESVTVAAPSPVVDPEDPQSQQNVSGAELLAVPYPNTNNLKNALRIVPGVVRDSSGGIHLSGGAESQALYTLNGFNVGDPLTGTFETRIGVEAVQSLQVSSSRYSAEYGKGSAGVLAINTTTGDDKFRYTATNFLPGVETHKGIFIGNWTPRFGVSGPIRRGRIWFSDTLSIVYDKRVVEDLPKGQDRTSSWRFSNLVTSQVNLSPSNILHTSFLGNYWNAPRTGLGVLDPIETTVDRRTRQWFVAFKDQIYFQQGALMEFGYAANRTFAREIPQGRGMFLLTPGGTRGYNFVDAMRSAGRDQWLANVFLPRSSSHQIKTGIDINRLQYQQDVHRTGIEYLRPDGIPLRRTVFGGNGAFVRSAWEAAAYVQDTWRVRPGIVLELGLRSDWDSILHNYNFSPRAAFAWSPKGWENTKISGGYAIVYDATNLRLFTRPLDQYSLATTFNPDGSILRGPALSLYTIDSYNLRSPRYGQWSLGVAQQLPSGFSLRIDLLRKRGREGLTYMDLTGGGKPLPNVVRYRIPAPEAYDVDSIYTLSNMRKDVFDSVEFSIRQVLAGQYEWMASYVRSRALSNAVMDVNIDDPILVSDNAGPMPWDTPHRFLSWGYLPLPFKNWAAAYLLEWRSGFPFSVVSADGAYTGGLNTQRFPQFFELNLHVERRFVLMGHKIAIRGGLNNVTNHRNYDTVNSNIASADFMRYYGGQRRALNFRIRWLGRL